LLREAVIEAAFRLVVLVPSNGSALNRIKESNLAKVVPNTFNPNVTGCDRGDISVTR
jgi:hypothetical protein